MAEIIHEFPIQTSPEKVYRALTDSDSLSKWWLPGSKVDSYEGGLGTFPLADGQNRIVLQLIQLSPAKRVVWKCLEHKFAEWADTTLTFEIIPTADGFSTLRFIHAGWRDTSGGFAKTSFYWASLYLRNLKQLLESDYSWSEFEINYYYPVDIAKLFSAWTTAAGLKSFFIEDISLLGSDGKRRGENQPITTGDKYSWKWRHGYALSGEFTNIVNNKHVEFSFGSMHVAASFEALSDAVLLQLKQTQIPISEDGKAHSHMNCRLCWTFFLTNLKSVLLTGTDLRDQLPARASSFEVGFKPPEV